MLLRASIGLVVAIAVATALAAGRASGGASGALTLQASLPMQSAPGRCPPGNDAAVLCARRTGSAAVPGLGEVSHAYDYIVEECGTNFHIGGTTVRLTVAGKGTIDVLLAPSDQCYPSALVAVQRFTVTGGSGVYAGASGGGIVDHKAGYTATGSAGTDTWSGTLTVPGLEFDLAAPTISGAVKKVVRAPRKAKRVRVRYVVTAVDDVDGGVPVACKPKSGSFFRVGRGTTVRCAATDTSANTANARFTVTVKRGK